MDLSQQQKQTLLKIARESAEFYVKADKIKDFKIIDGRLQQPEGAFVTLHENGELRGCIGQIISDGSPLWQVVRDMAIEAATSDPRFASVEPADLPGITFEISVLSAPERIDDWHKIELGKHGVIVSKDFRKGVFLPQVATETGWTREEFLEELCVQKAGLGPFAYKNDSEVCLEVFTAQVFKEEE